MRAFFNTLKDGVAVVDGQGKVQFANAAGNRFAALAVGEPFPEPRVLAGLADLVADAVGSDDGERGSLPGLRSDRRWGSNR